MDVVKLDPFGACVGIPKFIHKLIITITIWIV